MYVTMTSLFAESLRDLSYHSLISYLASIALAVFPHFVFISDWIHSRSTKYFKISPIAVDLIIEAVLNVFSEPCLDLRFGSVSLRSSDLFALVCFLIDWFERGVVFLYDHIISLSSLKSIHPI